ncbi:MAG: Mov34/MPN/PAD-1 family protein [Thermoplasmatota archaeon]
MGFFKKRNKKEYKQRSWKITKECLNLIFECSKSNFPHEFAGLLRVDDENKDTISEVVIIPGTISGDSHAIFQMHMRPIDFSIIGTVHSHPSPLARPSDADLQLFYGYGKVHIIAAMPYSGKSWKAYDNTGKEIILTVV